MKTILFTIILSLFTTMAANNLPAKPILFVDYLKLEQQSIEYKKIQKIEQIARVKKLKKFNKKVKIACALITKKMNACATLPIVDGFFLYYESEYDITKIIIDLLNKEYNISRHKLEKYLII